MLRGSKEEEKPEKPRSKQLAQQRVANRKSRNAPVEAKNRWIEKQTLEIENCSNRHHTKKGFETAKALTKSELKVKHAVAIEDIAKRLGEYREELYT